MANDHTLISLVSVLLHRRLLDTLALLIQFLVLWWKTVAVHHVFFVVIESWKEFRCIRS